MKKIFFHSMRIINVHILAIALECVAFKHKTMSLIQAESLNLVDLQKVCKWGRARYRGTRELAVLQVSCAHAAPVWLYSFNTLYVYSLYSLCILYIYYILYLNVWYLFLLLKSFFICCVFDACISFVCARRVRWILANFAYNNTITAYVRVRV